MWKDQAAHRAGQYFGMRVQGNVWGLQKLAQEAHAMVQRAEREAMSGMLLTGEPSPSFCAPQRCLLRLHPQTRGTDTTAGSVSNGA